MSDRALLEAATQQEHARCNDCADFDEDCEDISDKVACWLYAPERGMCPYLRAAAIGNKLEKSDE